MSQISASAPERPAFTTRELVFTAAFAALMAVCSWISIPTTVPFTLQTFAVYCALAFLGGKKGFYAIFTYILLGAVGMPVFAEFTAGLGIILGTTGGYIIGFLATAAVYWIFEKLPYHETLWMRVTALILGAVFCYVIGTAWFMYVYAKNIEAVDLKTALAWCVTPFIIPDILKLALAVILTERLKKHVRI